MTRTSVQPWQSTGSSIVTVDGYTVIVPSQEHCAQNGGVERRDCVSVMVDVQPGKVLGMTMLSLGSAVASFARSVARSRMLVLKAVMMVIVWVRSVLY